MASSGESASWALLFALLAGNPGCGNSATATSHDAGRDSATVDIASDIQSDVAPTVDATSVTDTSNIPVMDIPLTIAPDASIFPPFDALEFPTPDVMPPPEDDGAALPEDASTPTDAATASDGGARG